MTDELSFRENLASLFKSFKVNMTKKDAALFDACLDGIKIRRDGLREVSNLLVEDALFQKAMTGDVRACLVWLKLKSPEDWDELVVASKRSDSDVVSACENTENEIVSLLEKSLGIRRNIDDF